MFQTHLESRPRTGSHGGARERARPWGGGENSSRLAIERLPTGAALPMSNSEEPFFSRLTGHRPPGHDLGRPGRRCARGTCTRPAPARRCCPGSVLQPRGTPIFSRRSASSPLVWPSSGPHLVAQGGEGSDAPRDRPHQRRDRPAPQHQPADGRVPLRPPVAEAQLPYPGRPLEYAERIGLSRGDGRTRSLGSLAPRSLAA